MKRADKMILRTAMAAMAVGIAGGASPASAAIVYDAFTSFNGTQGAGNFTYGYVVGGVETNFETNTSCVVPGTSCLRSNIVDDGGVPTALKSTTAFQFSTVAIPDDRLLLHPGASSDVFIKFTAPKAGKYQFFSYFNIIDLFPSGVGLTEIDDTTLGFFPVPSGTLYAPGQSASFGSNVYDLIAGDSFGWRIDNQGNYFNDSVGVNLRAVFTAVPEPASWALMIAGFGAVGAAARRRRTVTFAIA